MPQPDSFFMEKLKELDPKLDCQFNRDTQKFNITYDRVGRDPVVLFPIESESGGYRQPDRRDLNVLGESDCARISMRERLDKTSKYMSDYREKQARDAKGNIRHMTLDNRRQLVNAVGKAGNGKHNSTFRRIEHKPKGEVFK